MMRSGRVIRVQPGQATVRFEPESACASCHSKDACGTGGPGVDLVVPLGVDDRIFPGEVVQVSVEQATAFRATANAYLVPLAGLVLAMSVTYALGWSDPLVALASFAGMFAGFMFSRRLARLPAFRPRPQLVGSGPIAPSNCSTPLPKDRP